MFAKRKFEDSFFTLRIGDYYSGAILVALKKRRGVKYRILDESNIEVAVTFGALMSWNEETTDKQKNKITEPLFHLFMHYANRLRPSMFQDFEIMGAPLYILHKRSSLIACRIY